MMMDTVEVATRKPSAKGVPIAKVLIGLAIVAGLIALGRVAGGSLPRFAQWVEGLGVWGPIVYIAGYAVAAVAFLPGSILTLAGGAIFGLVKGTIYVFIAAVLGASAAFLISRHAARGMVERRIAGNPRFASIDRAVAAQGRKIVFLLRLSPVVPFNLLNYALGLTKVRFSDYMLAMVGMLPGTILYVYYGKLAGDVAALAGGAAVERNAGYYAVLVLGLAATILVTAIVTRIARRALEEATQSADRSTDH